VLRLPRIGKAIGLLRAETKLSSQQAFQALSRASQRTNVKLRDLAQRISDGAGQPADGRSPVGEGDRDVVPPEELPRGSGSD
jgi:hypothetical protein